MNIAKRKRKKRRSFPSVGLKLCKKNEQYYWSSPAVPSDACQPLASQ
jgi:hypothetical protein